MAAAFRFVAFIWNALSAPESSEVKRLVQLLSPTEGDWSCALRIEGLWVFHTGDTGARSQVQRFDAGQGVILGRVFRRPGLHRQTFDELIDGFWGRYVAFVTDTATHTTRVLRSPAGALNCFLARSGGVRILFADVRDYLVMHSGSLAINWPWMATLLAYPRHAMGSSATGILGIEQLQPGECLICSSGRPERREVSWNPFRIASSEPVESFEIASAQIREAVQSTIWSWAEDYPRILVLLSGGLDSSIVLNCLSRAPSKPLVTCVTYFDESCPTGDERTHARLSASRSGCRLIEVEDQSAATDLTSILRIARHPVPWSYLLYVRHSTREMEIAKDTASSAIFCGTAGDQVFFYGPAVLAAADYLRRHGIFSRFIPYALDVARRNRLSLWSVLSAALRAQIRPPDYEPVRDNEAPHRLITREAIQTANECVHMRHYWLPLAENVPHGKLLHVMMSDCLQDLHDPFGGADPLDRVQALNAQPVLETCLRIPTYVLTRGGWNRAAARAAFASELSSRTVSRAAKGYIDSQNADLLQRNLPMVRELLLEGHLVENRLIDRRKVEEILTPGRVRLSADAGEVLCEHLSYEAWARSWTPTSGH